MGVKYSLENQVVLITGGSQGLGRQFAQKYFSETVSSKIIIVSRSETKLQTAINDISKGDNKAISLTRRTSQETIRQNRIFYIPCDLSEYNSVESLFDTLNTLALLPTQILSCAGGSTPKLFKDLTSNELTSGVGMNYMTALYLSHQVAKTNPKCHLILFSSVTAFFPFIGYSQYAPSKVALKALIGILRQELPNTRVSCVYPGNFKSEGFELEELTKPDITRDIEGPSYPISCEVCCDKIVWWLEKGYDDITTDTIGWLLMSLDMGLNKHHNNSFLWFLQIILGAFVNLLIVPLYMIICSMQITSYHKKNKRSKQDTANN